MVSQNEENFEWVLWRFRQSRYFESKVDSMVGMAWWILMAGTRCLDLLVHDWLFTDWLEFLAVLESMLTCYQERIMISLLLLIIIMRSCCYLIPDGGGGSGWDTLDWNGARKISQSSVMRLGTSTGSLNGTKEANTGLNLVVVSASTCNTV